MPLRTFAACLAVVATSVAWLPSAQAATRQWNFTVTLDDKPIGDHRFTVDTDGAERRVTSTARYRVKVFGLTVYRYDHHAEEHWVDRCLDRLDAQTNDDGKQTSVQGHYEGRDFVWQVQPAQGGASTSQAVCPMTFAYWSPDIATRSTLLDPGSGRLERVQIAALPPATIDVHGAPTAVRGLRINGLKHPIDVWYAGDEWVGLDTTVAGQRRLRYRLP